MESASPESISEVDVFAAETIENWYPTYDLLRSECPVYHVPDTETYFLTRYQDIHQILIHICMLWDILKIHYLQKKKNIF